MFSKRKLVLLLLVLLLVVSLLQTSFPGQAFERPSLEEVALKRVADATVLYLDSPYTIVNGTKKLIDEANLDITPIEQGGRTLLPLRFVAESLGAKVDWDASTLTATIVLDQKTIKLTVDKAEMTINSSTTKLDVPARIKFDRTYIPIRALSEALEKKVFFDSSLIVISNQENIINKASEQTLIDELIFLCAGRGNSTGNLISYSDGARVGDWLFYTNSMHNYQLYKSKIDGSKITKLSSDKARSINVIGNTIYYLVPSGTRKAKIIFSEYDQPIYDIYKIKADGTGRTKLSQEKSLSWISVVGNWIYYVNAQNHLSKIKIDGTSQTQICDDLVSEYGIVVDNGWIYYSLEYIKDGDTSGLYRVHTDGQDKMKIIDQFVNSYDITKDWIYYGVTDTLFKAKLDGSEVTEIRDQCYAEEIHVLDNWIYFREITDHGKLYRMKVDGTQKTKLNGQDSFCITILGEWIYCRYNWGKDTPMYKLKLDGSSEQKVY